MEFHNIINLIESKNKQDNRVAMEYLKYKYPKEMPRSVRAILYSAIEGSFMEEYCEHEYNNSFHNFGTWEVKWKDNE